MTVHCTNACLCAQINSNINTRYVFLQTRISRLPPGTVPGQSLAIEGGVCRLVNTTEWTAFALLLGFPSNTSTCSAYSLHFHDTRVMSRLISFSFENEPEKEGKDVCLLVGHLQDFLLPLPASSMCLFASSFPKASQSHLDETWCTNALMHHFISFNNFFPQLETAFFFLYISYY